MVCNMVLYQLQWRQRWGKGGREITESERGGQDKMRGGKGRREDSFKAREEGGRTHLPDLTGTVRDEGTRLMVP